MSYNNKNNLEKQLDFLDKYIQLYGISSLCDTETEIRSSELENFDKMNDYLPDIKKIFKVSIMNLNRSNNKITNTNAISILKHLCIQARVPFDITKYSLYYTFSLAPRNILLEKIRDKSIQKYTKPYNTNNLYRLTNDSVNDVKLCTDTGNDIAIDVKELLDIKHQIQDYCLLELVKNNNSSSVSANAVLSGYVKQRFEINTSKFISIGLARCVDIYNKILSVKLYDKNGICFLTTNKINISADTFHTVFENVTELNCPVWSIPYTNICLTIPYTDKKPFFYKIEINCTMLNNKKRKILAKNWNNIDISDGCIKYDLYYNMVKITSLDNMNIPRCGNIIYDIKSTKKIFILYNRIQQVSINNTYIPLPIYTEVKISNTEDEEYTVSFKYKNSDQDVFLLDNKICKLDHGVINIPV